MSALTTRPAAAFPHPTPRRIAVARAAVALLWAAALAIALGDDVARTDADVPAAAAALLAAYP